MMFIARKIICLFNLYMKFHSLTKFGKLFKGFVSFNYRYLWAGCYFLTFVQMRKKNPTKCNVCSRLNFAGEYFFFKIPRYRLYFVWGYYVIWTWPLLPYIYREVPVMIGSYIPHGASVSIHLISPVQSLENTSPLLSYRAQENVTLSTLSGEERDSSTSPTVYRLETGAE